LNHASADLIVLLAPLTGVLVPLAEVPDSVFAGGVFGESVGIDPLAGHLCAPCDGVISYLASTGHAVMITAVQRVEILLHIGIDTVAMKGRGFMPQVKQGAHVRAGDVLIEFDLDLTARVARSLVSVMVVTNSDDFTVIERANTRMLMAGATKLLTLRAHVAREDAEEAADSGEEASRRQVVLTQPGGLHARTAARARIAVQDFDARVEVHFDGRKAALESVAGLLGLGASVGAVIDVVGSGTQAAQAVEAAVEALLRPTSDETAKLPASFSAACGQSEVAPEAAQNAHALAGVCASPGIAAGALVRWDSAEFVLPELAGGTPAAESCLLDQALAAVDGQLCNIVREASQRGAVGEAEIFTVHRVLLEDPALIDAARDQISLGKSAGFAWHASLLAQIDVLANVTDALLAERAADLRDIDKRVLQALGYNNMTTVRVLPDKAILAAAEFTPSDLSSFDRGQVMALVMARGGATSHAAIIARQLAIPMLVAVGDALYSIADGTKVVVDATAGRIEYAPTAAALERALNERQRLAEMREANRLLAHQAVQTVDGRAIEVAANVATIDDVNVALRNGADAIGLLRTELMFIHRQLVPTVDEHRQSYQSVINALQGRIAIIRTLDIGADKEVDYLTLPPESNPALGLRGIRLARIHPTLLDDQLKALLAVTPCGAVRILLPMVTDVGELLCIRARIDALARDLGRTEKVELGVMIEVPAAALLADQLARHADFLSIGTNDLTQYTLAMDRGQAELAALVDGLHPAVLRLIEATVRGAEQHGKWTGVCGALAGDLLALPLLIGLGVTELSVEPEGVPSVKARIRNLDYATCRQRARDALALDSAQAVRAMSRELWPLD